MPTTDLSMVTPELLDYIRGRSCVHDNAVSFLKGFILGQLTVIIIVIVAVRYLLMEDVKKVKKRYIPSRLASPPTASKSTSAAQSPSAFIGSKIRYDIGSHSPESTDWLNVLLAQVIVQYRDDAQVNNRLMSAIDEVLNSDVRPGFLGAIQVTQLSLGEDFPLFSNARIRSSDDAGSMRAEIDFEYNDQLTLGIETRVILNWPRQAFAALPVSLVLSVVRFSGTLTIELVNPPETTTKPQKPLERYIAISSYSDFTLDLDVRSLIGSRTKLEDIPKLRDLIQTKLRNVYIDKLVYPMFVKVKVPNMWSDATPEEAEAKMSPRLPTEPLGSTATGSDTFGLSRRRVSNIITETSTGATSSLLDTSGGVTPKAKDKMKGFVEEML